MQTLAFKLVTESSRPYLALLHTAAPPAADEWSAYVKVALAAVLQADAVVPAIVLTDGGGPDAGQRKELADALGRSAHGAVTHVFTTSPFVRSLVTAFRWLSWSPAVAHSPGKFADVCAQCSLSPFAVFSDLVELQKGMPRVAVLGKVEQSMTQPESARL